MHDGEKKPCTHETKERQITMVELLFSALKLTILHPLATNALKYWPLFGQMNSGFKLLPEILGQNETLRNSMA